MTATAIPGQYLLIGRLISGADQLTFYLCWAPPGRPATMTAAGKEVPECNLSASQGFTLSGSANTHRKTVILRR